MNALIDIVFGKTTMDNITIAGAVMKAEPVDPAQTKLDRIPGAEFVREITLAPNNLDYDSIMTEWRNEMIKPFSTISGEKEHLHYSKLHGIGYAMKHLKEHIMVGDCVFQVS